MLTTLVFHSCSQEEETKTLTTAVNQQREIVTAKNWFESYKTKIAVDPQFSDLTYHWELAFENILEDGSKAIVIPLTENHPNPEYKGEKVLYLYPFEQEYNALVQELIPQSHKITKKEILQNLDTYTGYIITWNLEKGFVKGAKFENSIAVSTLNVKTETKLHSLTGREAAIELDEVLVSSGSASAAAPRDFSIGAAVGGGGAAPKSGAYINPPHGASEGSSPETSTNANPCDKLKKLKDDPNYKKALVELKKNFKLQYETGYYISKSKGYVAGTPDSNLALTGTRYSDSYGVMHVHEDPYTHMVDNGGIRPEDVNPIHMFSPKDVNTFCSLLITANKYKTSSLDEVFNEMVSSSGTYQLRFEGDINNVKNFDFGGLKDTYRDYMKLYKDDLESGFLSFIKDYIGINGITLYKIKEDGTSESKTLSANNQLISTPC